MPGHLLVSALHKQAFASATKHQLLAFLQVAAFTNRTALLGAGITTPEYKSLNTRRGLCVDTFAHRGRACALLVETTKSACAEKASIDTRTHPQQAVLPFARFGEPAFVGFPESGFEPLSRYFDVDELAGRWPRRPTRVFGFSLDFESG